MTTYKRTLLLPKEKIKKLNRLLNTELGELSKKEIYSGKQFSKVVSFPDDTFVCITIHDPIDNDYSLWAKATLYTTDGREIGSTDQEYVIDQEWELNNSGNIYIVEIKAKP